VICRDRAGADADGARTGAPQAQQVADRWHLWHNLADHIETTVLGHRGCLREPIPEPPTPTPPVDPAPLPAPAPPEKKLVTRTTQRYAAVQELRGQGVSIWAIARSLHLDVQTVRRFARASSLDELLAKTAERASVLDAFTPYLQQRWNQGCTDAALLTTELKAQGYAGSDQTVRRSLRPFRHGRPTPPPGPTPPTVREVTGWILRRPDSLDPEEQTRLQQVLARCPHLDTTAAHVAAFAEIMSGLHGDRLDAWIGKVEADDLPDLHSFVAGVRRDHQAVTNGLTLPYSSGAVEGNVNRIILWNLECQVRVVSVTTCRHSTSGGRGRSGGVDPDEAVVPGVVFWVVAAPGAAVAGQALFQAVAGPPRKLQRWRVVGVDLQPDPGKARGGVRPRRQGLDAAPRDAATALLRPHPVGQLGAVWAVQDEAERGDQPRAVQHPEGDLPGSVRVPGPQGRPRILQRVGTGGAGTPQGRGRLCSGGLDQQRRVLRGQGAQAQVAQVQLHKQLHKQLHDYPFFPWWVCRSAPAPVRPPVTSTIGSRVAVVGAPSCRGEGPAGVGMSASRSRSWSRAA
jgi:hypothetical protein